MIVNQKIKFAFYASVLFVFFSNIGMAQGFSSPTKILVRERPSSASTVRSLLSNTPQAAQLSQQNYLPKTRTHILELPPHSDAKEWVEYFRSQPDIESAEIDSEIHASSTPDDEFFNTQWAASTLHLQNAWDLFEGNASVTVAVVDSGCDLNHEDLTQNFWTNSQEVSNNQKDDDDNGYIDDRQGYDFLNDDAQPSDDFGHGTLVTGIIAAVADNQVGIAGIARHTKIMCLKVLNSKGDSNLSTAIEAIEYAIEKQANIINLSWGYIPDGAPSEALETAIREAQSAGVLIITSAGNGIDLFHGDDNDADPDTANYPSSYTEDNVIAVAATDAQDELANFSNYGLESVDLGAPGVSILSTYPGNYYQSFSGTSAAAPHVTGAAALLWSANPSLSYSDIRRLLLETTDPLDSLYLKTTTGGRLNVESALLGSPASGGHLLETPSPSANDLSHSEKSGGCELHPSAVFSASAFLPWAGVLPLLWLLRRKTEFHQE